MNGLCWDQTHNHSIISWKQPHHRHPAENSPVSQTHTNRITKFVFNTGGATGQCRTWNRTLGWQKIWFWVLLPQQHQHAHHLSLWHCSASPALSAASLLHPIREGQQGHHIFLTVWLCNSRAGSSGYFLSVLRHPQVINLLYGHHCLDSFVQSRVP